MATRDALEVINEAARTIYDVLHVAVPADDLLKYLNAGQVEAVTIAPKVNAVSANVQLAAGITQSLPVGAIALIAIPWNMSDDGYTIGLPINPVKREIINKRNPAWTTDTPSETVRAYIYDENDPLKFDVYPAQPDTPTFVKLVYSKIPRTIPDYVAGTKITIADQWFNVLVNYVCYRVFAETSEAANSKEKRDFHYQMFLGGLGVTGTKETPK